MSAVRRAGAAVVLVVLAGCGAQDQGQDQDPHPAPTRPVLQENPPWRPLSSAAPAAEVPPPLVGTASVARTVAAAEAGPGRAEAERFALLAAQLLLDVRAEQDGEESLRAIASSRLDPSVRAYLVDEIDGQQQVGTRRAIKDGREIWIRSAVHGDQSEPDRVDVELYVDLTSPTMAISFWQGVRLDLARDDGRWWVVGFADGHADLLTGRDLSPAQRREQLTGPGWRRIAPAP